MQLVSPPTSARYDIAPDPPDHVIDVIGDSGWRGSSDRAADPKSSKNYYISGIALALRRDDD
jgi:hypothetical protein